LDIQRDGGKRQVFREQNVRSGCRREGKRNAGNHEGGYLSPFSHISIPFFDLEIRNDV